MAVDMLFAGSSCVGNDSGLESCLGELRLPRCALDIEEEYIVNWK